MRKVIEVYKCNLINLYSKMINQNDGATNQYGFYAVPKALQPKRKYRQTSEYNDDEYSDEQIENENQFEFIDREEESQRNMQRDFYVDEAPYPQFKPKERGLDYGVQIEREDLFDFDLEVQPLLEILVGRSVVTAINELQEEKQINERKQALDHYQKKRNAELMVTQRLQTKSKRKKEEVDRRKLQKETFVKNQKEAGKKIISRKNAKHSLLNLKKQVLEELEEEGFLRKENYSDLRIEYEGWLYEQIETLMKIEQESKQVIEEMVNVKQAETEKDHQSYIKKEQQRRQGILDEKQRIRKENEERKRKKKIRKQRLQLNKEYLPKSDSAEEAVQKYEPVNKVLKWSELGNGLTKKKNTNQTLHIGGGIFNYIIAFLNSQQKEFTAEEVELLVEKILLEMETKLEIILSEEHYEKFVQLKKKLEEDDLSFMKNKTSLVSDLAEQIGLDFSLLESFGIYIKSKLHNALILSILNISLNALPNPKKQGEEIVDSYETTERDKKREELKEKIEVVGEKQKSLNQIQSVENVVRVHFQKVREEEQPEQSVQKTEEQLLNEWIDVFDGENWIRNNKDKYADCEKGNQSAASFQLTGFNNTLIVDERNFYYVRNELQKLLDCEGGSMLKNYEEGLQNVREKIGEVPVFDAELEWQ